MGTAVAKPKQERTSVLSRRTSAITTKPVTPSRNSAKVLSRQSSTATKPETEMKLTANGRTKLANDCGKVVNAIFRFTEKHKLSPSLERRLKNCANDLWDIEWEEDVKSGAYERSEFGKLGRRAAQDHKEGKTYSLEETLEMLNKRLK